MHPMSIIEVAKALNMTPQQVKLIEKTALAKVRVVLLTIDSIENWIEIISQAKETDQYQQYLEDNSSI